MGVFEFLREVATREEEEPLFWSGLPEEEDALPEEDVRLLTGVATRPAEEPEDEVPEVLRDAEDPEVLRDAEVRDEEEELRDVEEDVVVEEEPLERLDCERAVVETVIMAMAIRTAIKVFIKFFISVSFKNYTNKISWSVP